ncbi:hypothetical protein N0B31_10210 [Salinirubellus salinus]|uniref:Uncharacterized protein n=1 Tax=Salinirubellus salinus TaxID=1364945 RepID=A0A9E7R8V4_9EURY|nr:hypothetical protein [Salinirubellus salinus]UWM56648.1 hypothetical protein N0B31_10210 [Salinirubellus salinus]
MNSKLTAVLFAVLIATSGVGVVSADHTTSVFDDLTEGDGVVAQTVAGVDGVKDRLVRSAMDRFGDDDTTVTDSASALKSEINQNSDLYQQRLNTNIDASTTRDTIEVTHCQDGNKQVQYVTADVVDGSYTNLSVVDSTNRTADEWVYLEEPASENVADELQSLRQSYIGSGDAIPRSAAVGLGAEYKGSASTSLMEHDKPTCGEN